MVHAVLRSCSSLSPLPGSSSSADLPTASPASASPIFGSQFKLAGVEHTHGRFLNYFKGSLALRLKASRESQGLTEQVTHNKQISLVGTQHGSDLFSELKHRFLSFKKHKFLENFECFQNLAKGQSPKFMVVACADSRVCPSHVLGFQPGEAFVVRNVANLVPPYENGPSETNAALEFAVNALEVEYILVVGHSFCGGIRALMSMQDKDNSSSFIQSWVVVGKNARLSTKAKAAASNLDFEQQCRHCEKVSLTHCFIFYLILTPVIAIVHILPKESINRSLLNLLTYPWIEEKVGRGLLSIHGGYYDFVDCTFEKWTLDYEETTMRKETGICSLKDREIWS